MHHIKILSQQISSHRDPVEIPLKTLNVAISSPWPRIGDPEIARHPGGFRGSNSYVIP